eukprot:gb/GECH01002228.1/.p1 GENE.gb/GECH01002228.1/~~gb/GECH01002228.1/.p1  ORF type:complete len:487 (+),score=88.86 gb/GECH01002228.1/:1-1461(+)
MSKNKKRHNSGRKIAVIVLGDVGHSPRMSYHTLSLASNPDVDIDHVYLVGYTASDPHPAVRGHPRISIVPIPTRLWTWTSQFLPFFIAAPIKAFMQACSLLFTLLFLLPQGIDAFLLQTPPAVPTLPIAVVASRIRSIPLIVDWHNLGYTILALRYTSSINDRHLPLLVRIYRSVEAYCAPFAHRHLCVSRAFAEYLLREFGITAHVVYDRPHPLFIENTSLSLLDRHQLFARIMPSRDDPSSIDGHQSKPSSMTSMVQQTPFTTLEQHRDHVDASLRADRPLLLVSSTSWTKDEDFGLLFDALRSVRERNRDIRIHAIITGKGPEKAFYEVQMEKEGFLVSPSSSSSSTSSNITVETAWLKAEDYPRLLASADLGVCLHRSSSGVDLPMKIIDMFGAGVPVCAVEYPTIFEQVQHESTGLIFRTSEELADQLMRLADGFPTEQPSELIRMKKTVAAVFHQDPEQQWNGHWRSHAWPVIEQTLSMS